MKKGRGIGSLLLAVLACAAELRAQEVQWQAVGDAPRTQSALPAATLDAPVALRSSQKETHSPHPAFHAPPSASTTGELLPVSFQMYAPDAAGAVIPPTQPAGATVIPPIESAAGGPPVHAEIIAVSAPVSAPTTPSDEEQDEQTDTLFASDRPMAARKAARSWGGPIVRTSASAAGPNVAEVPMVPGWDAPLDASWGTGTPTGQSLFNADLPTFAPINPLRPRLYASGEYLLWWIQGQATPVLATTSAPSDFGILGAPTTQILYGGNQINGNSPFSGGRFTVGYWLGCEQNKALEITGFFLGSRAGRFTTNSSLNPLIGRPFVEANTGQESAQLTSLPNVSAGTLTVAAPTSLWGIAGNLRCLVCCGCNYRITTLAGFRNINLNEDLGITENVLGLPTAPQPFTNQMITVADRFATQNHFYGGNIGADAIWFWGRFSIDVRAQVALGDTVQMLDISGTQRFVSPAGAVQNFTGGLLALPSNIGHFSHNAFSVVPEIGVNLGYQILPNLRAYVGYNFLYWSNVIRPGTSINPVLDVTQIPNFPLNPEPMPLPGLHPAPFFHEVGFWAQGLTFGFQFVY